jgi:hypothetical protein
MRRTINLFFNGVAIYAVGKIIIPLFFLLNFSLGAIYFSISLLLLNALMIVVYDLLLNTELLAKWQYWFLVGSCFLFDFFYGGLHGLGSWHAILYFAQFGFAIIFYKFKINKYLRILFLLVIPIFIFAKYSGFALAFMTGYVP